MRTRRRLLVSAAVVVALFTPVLPATASPDTGQPGTGKQALLLQPADRADTRSPRPTPTSGAALSRLADARDKGRVVFAVKLREGVPGAAAAVTVAARTRGGLQRRSLRQLNTVTVEVPEAAAKEFTARMRDRRDVASVELVPRRTLSTVPPDDEKYPATASYLGAVNAPAAWAVHTGDPGLLIAVVDSGVDVNHPDLTGRIAGTYNAVTGGTDVTDTVGHGTFVAGVAAATGNNGIGIAGASMGASVLAVKVASAQGDIWTDNEVAGILWAVDHGAKVINLSLGGETPSQTESGAIAYAVGKGVLVVAAAGNNSSPTPTYPAAYPQVVAVGSTDAAGHRATFSSFGPWVTVAAPGVGITGTTPTAGSSFMQPGYDVSNGTSFSSPLVSAEAALLWSLRPTASASDVRQAIVSSSRGYGSLGLGAGQVDFRAAYDALRPDSVPDLTQPGEGNDVAGVVRLSATSTAPKVRFLIDGKATGAPVTTSAGVASTTWTSWGAANGRHTVSAGDCGSDNLCNARTTTASVTLSNTAPAVTSPRASQSLTGSATFTATAPGGGVAFSVDGIRRGFDSTAPYSLTYPISSLVDGRHAISVRSCGTTVTTCTGPMSPPVSFSAKSLHPRITALSPSLFSPNRDGRYDTTRLTYYLPDTETVRFQVRNAAGTIVRGPLTLGTLGAGTRNFIWNGLLNTGAPARNGAYTVELATSRAALRGSAVSTVTVDTTAATLAPITGASTTFYPYPDSYKDTFAAGFSLNERAAGTLTVRTTRGVLVRSIAGPRTSGTTKILWNGKNTAGARVAAGTYYWTLTAQDSAGNRRTSSRYSVVVNAKRMVTKSVTVSLRGSQYLSAGGSAGCAWASTQDSDFRPYGVWLANGCDNPTDGSQIAAATYRFTLPIAVIHTSIRLDTYGNSSTAPSTLGAAFTRWTTGDYTTREITVGSGNAWRTVATLAPAALVNSRTRQVETTLFVPDDYSSASDYDVSVVHLVVGYKVLV